MTAVPAVLLQKVEQDPAQADAGSVGPYLDRQLTEAALGQGAVEPGPGSCHGVVVACVQRLRRVAGGRGELPVRVLRVEIVPAGQRLVAKLDRQLVVLDQSQVLEQAAKGQSGCSDPGVQARRI